MEENNYRKSWTRVQESEQPDNMIMAYLLGKKNTVDWIKNINYNITTLHYY